MRKLMIFGLILVLVASAMAVVEVQSEFSTGNNSINVYINGSGIAYIDLLNYVNYSNITINYSLDFINQFHYCYQEDHNVTPTDDAACIGLQHTEFEDVGLNTVTFNYTLPTFEFSFGDTIIQTKQGNVLKNVTLANSTCETWSRSSGRLRLQQYAEGNVSSGISCWNGTVFKDVYFDFLSPPGPINNTVYSARTGVDGNYSTGVIFTSGGGSTRRCINETLGCYFEDAVFWAKYQDSEFNLSIGYNNTASNGNITRINTKVAMNSSFTINFTDVDLWVNLSLCDCEGCQLRDDNLTCRVNIFYNGPTSFIYNLSLYNFNTSYEWGVDYCGFPTKSLNFSFKAFDGTPTNVDLESSVSFYRNTLKRNASSTALTGIDSFNMCVYPNWATLFGDVTIVYNNGSDPKEYSTFATVFDNSTDYIDIYVEGETSQVILTVNDQTGQPVQDAYIKVLKQNVANNTFLTTEVLRTDDNGQTIANLVLIDAFYKFIIEYDGIVRLIEPSSGGIRILSTTKTFVINLAGDDYFDNYDVVSNVFTSLSFTNATGRFEYIWSDPNADMHQGCLRVIQRNISADLTLSDSCLTTTAGSIFYDITGSQGNSYIASGYIKFDEEFVTDQLVHTIAQLFSFTSTGKDKDGLYMSFALILGLAFVGIPFPAVSMILMILGLIITVLLGFYKIGWGLVAALIVIVLIQLFRIRR